MKSTLQPKPPRQNLTIRMTPELKQRAQISAIQQQRSLSDLIEEALETLLNRQERAA